MSGLPNRRSNATREARIGGCKVFVTVGFTDDGAIGEVFVDVAPSAADDTTRSWAGCWSRAVSLALQAGLPVSKIVDHFRHTDFPPQGLVQPPEPMHFARSIVDWVVAVMEQESA